MIPQTPHSSSRVNVMSSIERSVPLAYRGGMESTYCDLAFIGAGNMAEAIAEAAIAGGVVEAGRMVAADPSPQRREVFSKMGFHTTVDNAEAVNMLGEDGQVLLAVKPQAAREVLPPLGEALKRETVVISIMAGVRAQRIAGWLGGDRRVVRVMPNTPLQVGRGMAGVALGPGAREGDEAMAMRLFGAGGSRAIRVNESEIDAVTAVSGSGPAYLFYLAQAMEEAAAAVGLGGHARELVSQTLLGAAELLVASGESPEELRRRVTSPGGTTEAAVRHLDGNAMRQVMVNAVKAARDRGRELG